LSWGDAKSAVHAVEFAVGYDVFDDLPVHKNDGVVLCFIFVACIGEKMNGY